jgi:dihydroneopterin aldolase
MHMADALLSPAVAGTMYACSTAVAAYSVTKIRKEDDQTKIPTMGIMGAFVFAAQMINFTIPGTGSSGHLCGGMLLSAMLGAPAGFLTMIGILLIQCLMFADGGLMALGANVWNMAFYGYHGNLTSEQAQGQRFFVDVEITTDLTKAGQSDQLEDSINYVEVYELVESVMTGEKHNLLERLGALIADSLYQHYQGIVGLSVTVRKPSVPIAGILDYVEVVTTRGQI